MRCLTCNYDLRNLTEHRCPECGRAFDPKNPNTFGTRLSQIKNRDRMIGYVILGLIIVVLGVVLTCFGSAIFESIRKIHI